MLVQAPVLMIMSRPALFRIVSSRVPSQALMRIFSTMKSPGSRLEPGDRRGAPAAAHHRLVVGDALEERRVEGQSRRAGLDDEPDMDDGDAARPRRRGEPAHVLDDALRAGVRRRAGGGEGAALADDVVLHVLDDQGAAARIERQVLGQRRRRSGGRRAPIARRRGPAAIRRTPTCRARGAARLSSPADRPNASRS